MAAGMIPEAGRVLGAHVAYRRTQVEGLLVVEMTGEELTFA